MSHALSKMIEVSKETLKHYQIQFSIGQKVRVLKKVVEDGQTPSYWAGAIATVEAFTWRGDCMTLTLVHENGAVERFRDYELDSRYFKIKGGK
jgi:hypothetical protein